MPKHIPKDMEWFLADVIQQFTFANGDSPSVWVNTHLIRSTSPDEAFNKALIVGERYNDTYLNTDQVEVTSTFRGLRDLLLIYEPLEDEAEIIWTEYDDLSEEQIAAMITPRERLGAFIVHSEESPVTRESEEKKDEEGLESTESLNLAAQAKRDAGDYEEASALYEQSVRILRPIHRKPELAFALRHAADLHSQIGQLDQAAREIKDAIGIYRDTAYKDPLGLANSLRIAALNQERQAQISWRQAQALYSELDIQDGTDEARRHISMGDQQ